MSPNEETDKRNIESDDSKDVIKQTKNSEIKDDSLKDRYISINSAGFDIETMIKKFEERGVPLNLYRDTNDQVIDWSRLTVPENVWFEAYGEFTCLMLSKHPKLKNKPLVTFSAIIQLKCREHGIHITFSELASLVKSSRSEIGTAYKVISSLSDFKKPAMVICNEEESCLRWCSALNLPAPITQAVVELYADAKRLSIAPARSVNSMGAACIWFVISSYNKAISKYSIKFDKPRLPIIDITIASISDVTGMVSFTVQSGARLLNPVKDEVLSNEKLYKIMDEMGLLYKPEDLPDFGESEHLKVPEDSKVGSSQTSSPKSESQLNPPILPSEH
ncbi:hypothetical protein K502DRAFT_324198 [Neoconidiobolus thromboides FSU 785]|nr:hypothetical protein K502DRAFT_324198 [Neoconidiobolus thromboides FSU 785]